MDLKVHDGLELRLSLAVYNHPVGSTSGTLCALHCGSTGRLNYPLAGSIIGNDMPLNCPLDEAALAIVAHNGYCTPRRTMAPSMAAASPLLLSLALSPSAEAYVMRKVSRLYLLRTSEALRRELSELELALMAQKL